MPPFPPLATTHAKPERSFSKTALVLAGLAAERLVLRPKEDIPRPRFELLMLLVEVVKRAEENLMFPRRLKDREPDPPPMAAPPRLSGGVLPYCPEKENDWKEKKKERERERERKTLPLL